MKDKTIHGFINAFKGEKNKTVTQVTGTAVVNDDGEKFVRIDGSEVDTPVQEAVEISDGDRVVVTISNHTATVIGNTTSPASARTATKFMQLNDEAGLIIGNIVDEQPSGYYVILSPSEDEPGMYICGDDGENVAFFSKNRIKLGDENAVIGLCFDEDGQPAGTIQMVDGRMVLNTNVSIGVKAQKDSNVAEFVAVADRDGKPIASMETSNGTNADEARVQVTNGLVSLRGKSIELTTLSGGHATLNGVALSTDSDVATFVRTGTITGTYSKVLKKGDTVAVKCSVSSSSLDWSNYTLAGIREINVQGTYNSKSLRKCVTLSGFATNPSSSTVIAYLHNNGTFDIPANTMSVRFEWFAFRDTVREYGTSENVSLSDYTDTVGWSSEADFTDIVKSMKITKDDWGNPKNLEWEDEDGTTHEIARIPEGWTDFTYDVDSSGHLVYYFRRIGDDYDLEQKDTWYVLDGNANPYFIPIATQSIDGLMSGADKKKLDGISGGGSSVSIVTSWPSDATDKTVPSTKLVKSSLAKKVNTESGKGLSSNDFTDDLFTKLNGIAAGAQKNPSKTAVTVTNQISTDASETYLYGYRCGSVVTIGYSAKITQNVSGSTCVAKLSVAPPSIVGFSASAGAGYVSRGWIDTSGNVYVYPSVQIGSGKYIAFNVSFCA